MGWLLVDLEALEKINRAEVLFALLAVGCFLLPVLDEARWYRRLALGALLGLGAAGLIELAAAILLDWRPWMRHALAGAVAVAIALVVAARATDIADRSARRFGFGLA